MTMRLGDIWREETTERAAQQGLDLDRYAAGFVLSHVHLARPVTARFVKELNMNRLPRYYSFARLGSEERCVEVAVAWRAGEAGEAGDRLTMTIKEIDALFALANEAYSQAYLASMLKGEDEADNQWCSALSAEKLEVLLARALRPQNRPPLTGSVS